MACTQNIFTRGPNCKFQTRFGYSRVARLMLTAYPRTNWAWLVNKGWRGLVLLIRPDISRGVRSHYHEGSSPNFWHTRVGALCIARLKISRARYSLSEKKILHPHKLGTRRNTRQDGYWIDRSIWESFPKGMFTSALTCIANERYSISLLSRETTVLTKNGISKCPMRTLQITMNERLDSYRPQKYRRYDECPHLVCGRDETFGTYACLNVYETWVLRR